MGWAKYAEDDYELVCERQTIMEVDFEKARVQTEIINMHSTKERKNHAREILLVCKCCGKPFVFSSGEQRFYKENNLLEPKRCKECRKRKKLN